MIGMRPVVLVRACLLLALAACEDPDDVPELDEGSSSSSSEGSTTDACPELEPCDYCPGELTELCGMPCAHPGAQCSDELGGGMICNDGAWECSSDGPPIDDPCARLCEPSDACSERGCSSGVELQLFPSGGNPVAGSYELELTADAELSTCTFVISDGPGCAIPPCVTDTTCNASYVLDGEPARIELALPILASLAITVSRDGELVLDEQPELAYELDAPNGPGCLPVCAAASVRLDLQ